MLIQKTRTVRIIQLGDMYFGRPVTDDATEMLKIIRAYYNPEIINTVKRLHDADGNVCEKHQFLTHFKRAYKRDGIVFIEFDVWSESNSPIEDSIPIGQLIQHYIPTYQWIY